ncbi:MAG TPA: helix-turn-helix transcriptional regulator [Candidatus Saccharimonadales bacterium]|nr:helix-turn-helix transcriptional regulator [Candidatus Saccharimonadales bacterium]
MNSPKSKKIRKDLGQKLRTAREQLGLIQAEVAKKADITDNYYAMIERGEANPSYEKLQKILKVLNIKSLDLD